MSNCMFYRQFKDFTYFMMAKLWKDWWCQNCLPFSCLLPLTYPLNSAPIKTLHRSLAAQSNAAMNRVCMKLREVRAKILQIRQRDVVLEELQFWMKLWNLWPEQKSFNRIKMFNSFINFGIFIVPTALYIARSKNFLDSCEAVCECVGTGMFQVQLFNYIYHNEKINDLLARLRIFYTKCKDHTYIWIFFKSIWTFLYIFLAALEANIPEWQGYNGIFQDRLCWMTKKTVKAFAIEGFFYVFCFGLFTIIARLVGYDMKLSYGLHLE